MSLLNQYLSYLNLLDYLILLSISFTLFLFLFRDRKSKYYRYNKMERKVIFDFRNRNISDLMEYAGKEPKKGYLNITLDLSKIDFITEEELTILVLFLQYSFLVDLRLVEIVLPRKIKTAKFIKTNLDKVFIKKLISGRLIYIDN